MREIITELYKKLAGFFQTPEKENLKEVACNRLKLVLMQDRTNLTPQLLERMRGEMIDLLSKYVEMDKEALELNFAQEGDSMALMLSIPVVRAKDEEEIQALIKEEEERKAKAEAEKAQEEEEETKENKDEDSEEEPKEEISEEEEKDSEEEVEEGCACLIEGPCECQANENPEKEEQAWVAPKKNKKHKPQ
ncbi:MAG TPA: cell division topological specificity factor MinE [Candidatus Gastranaerophilaceae bacterium]|nr:cell division topological specificity factor MinE [Candidatus Gastranaerophilaceae bacterium]HPT41561.1 cell division topological specificity factor MinE [Candidatus Gastranaerophilaceae bacterium]